MARRGGTTVLLVVALLAVSLTTRAWGFGGHRLVNEKATSTLPEPLRVTAAREGVSTVVVDVSQAVPFAPFLAEKRARPAQAAYRSRKMVNNAGQR